MPHPSPPDFGRFFCGKYLSYFVACTSCCYRDKVLSMPICFVLNTRRFGAVWTEHPPGRPSQTDAHLQLLLAFAADSAMP